MNWAPYSRFALSASRAISRRTISCTHSCGFRSSVGARTAIAVSCLLSLALNMS